jgi:hypothetical protein
MRECFKLPSSHSLLKFRYTQTGESKQDAKRADPEATSPECDGEDICEVIFDIYIQHFLKFF